LYLPKSCPIQAIHVQGDTKFLRNIACLEACKQLHKIGALTDYLIPSIVVEEAEVEEFGKSRVQGTNHMMRNSQVMYRLNW
jgi:endoribonuclease Dicer